MLGEALVVLLERRQEPVELPPRRPERRLRDGVTQGGRREIERVAARVDERHHACLDAVAIRGRAQLADRREPTRAGVLDRAPQLVR